MQKVNQVPKMDSDYYLSREELEEAVKGLSDVDILRLTKIARLYTGNHDMEAGELLNEAVLRTLLGERKACPRNLPIVNFLAGVMRSIADTERNKKCNVVDVIGIDDCELYDVGDNPDDRLFEEQLFKQVEKFFDDDEEILLLILYLQEGYSPSEIQKEADWSETKYNSIRKRMRRKWNSQNIEELTS